MEEEGECEDGTQVRGLERKEEPIELIEWASSSHFA